jgi:ketosteroid isomerase-like protein
LTARPGRAILSRAMGTAMDTVTAAYSAVTQGRWDELASLLAADLDWYGLPEEDGWVPHCRGRPAALERVRHGPLTHPGQVTVRALVEHDDCVIADVVRREPDGSESERFVVAEVRGGEVARLRAFATEGEARRLLAH